MESSKNDFHKLGHAWKNAGDPRCSELVRRAKHIHQAIRNQTVAINIGDNSQNEHNEENYSNVCGLKRIIEEQSTNVMDVEVKKQK